VTGLWKVGVKFGTFAVVSLLLLMVLVNTMVNTLGGDTRTFDAEFAEVSGLRVGDDVKVAGVRVGRVESIDVDGDGARVSFQLTEHQPLLDTTQVVMRYQNLLGQRYLALVQGPHQGEELEDGATVPLDRTDPGFDLTELLNGFRPLFEVLRPQDVNRLATSVVQVLQGEGGTVEGLLRQTARLTNFIADRDDVIDEVVTHLTPVLRNLAGQGDRLSGTVRELRGLMTGLARERRSIGSSIDGVSQLVGATSDLLRDAREPAIRTVARFRTVAHMLSASREELNAALRSFGTTFESLGRSASYENAVNVYMCSMVFAIGDQDYNLAGDKGPWSEVCR
jgi:phospholipid/cholesterol/gamma-HCH transport system substrate-binding protein